MGVLTGIIRVAQAGIFSDLNNFTNYTILNNEYSNSFGLVENEVKVMLNYYDIGYEMPEVKSGMMVIVLEKMKYTILGVF